MKIASKFLRNADFFGTPFLQQINQKQSLYQSAIGGFITLIIFSSSLSYAIWILYQWQTNQFNPKISQSLYVSDFKQIDFNYDIVKIYFWKFEERFIDPFEEKVLLPVISYMQSDGSTTVRLIKMSNEATIDGNIYIIPKLHFGEQYYNGNVYISTDATILFIKCQQEYLEDGEQCANQEKSDQFFSQPFNVITTEITYKSIDSNNGQIKTSTQDYYFQVEPTNCYTLNIFLQSNLYEVRDYFLFGQPKLNEYINGAFIQTQTNTFNYCKQAYRNDAVGVVYLIMQGHQIKTIYEYPHAGDLLANIGSIVSLLFMIKYIIILLNQHFLQENLIHSIIRMYYPQFKNVKIFRNWKFNINKVSIGEKYVDVNQFKVFYDKTVQKAENKLSYLNLLYEISRLYFLIRSSNSRDQIRKSHQIGIRMSFLQDLEGFQDFNSKSDYSQRIDGQLLLNDEDQNILSVEEKNQIQSSEKIPEELCNQYDFFEINKIS
ncbi:unnamed protein product [Paramecium pentaurelia]|uniref:Transmembrane protein n=1 Tax=Paramecium pentaurelia TaxID=43138 RepID=A0A8S1T213_9CILI|nr:unnamed protein product [Paramecium pentaurelia]